MNKKKSGIDPITRRNALRRTKKMLQREWRLDSEPLVKMKLQARPPKGLGKNQNQIRALETPIETVDFADLDVDVAGHKLAAAETVGALRDVIWEGIPDKHRTAVTITEGDAYKRTVKMLMREWKLKDIPSPDKSLYALPPKGLGKNQVQVRALETPIECIDFADVHATVTGNRLVASSTVKGLHKVIWKGIPDDHKMK